MSQTVEYSLRAAVFLASQSPQPQTTRQIATATKVPTAYLSKVLQALNRAGVLISQRGISGGMSLTKDPAEISILDIVNAVDPIRRIKTCPLEISSHGVRLCPLHKRLDKALEMMEDAFRHTTLAEVLAEPSQSIPLCEFPVISTDKDQSQETV